MKKIFLCILLALPFAVSAEVPAFPMAFWGEVTIDGVSAPAGAVVRVYGGDDKVGEAVVQSGGVYGYTEPTKLKLLVEETDENLSFTIQGVSINGGVETAGLTSVIHSSFVSGETIEKNLDFKLTNQSTGGSSSGGGGGGKKKPKKTVPDIEELVLGVATTTVATTDMEKKVALQKQLILLLTQLISLLQQQMLLQGAAI